MTATKKPHALKRRIRETRRRKQRIFLAALIAIVALVSSIGLYSVITHRSPVSAPSFKAAIIDQLSGTFPNTSFNDNATATLVNAGYTVDYYAPDYVTVDLFRSLPSKNYGVILIRAHSTGYSTVPGQEISILTSEAYDPNRYVYEQLTDQIARSSLGSVDQAAQGEGQLYFAITPSFVHDSMQGKFPNSIIIMMGCTGLKNSNMAQAFVSKGASVYVSWDKSVTAQRTDRATVDLLRSLSQRKTVSQAVTAAMTEAGPDPIYNSQLGYYPNDQASLVLNTQHNPMVASSQVASEVTVKAERREGGDS